METLYLELIKNKKGTVRCKPPKYFDELYEREKPEEFKEIERKREKITMNKQKIQDVKNSYTRLKQLEVDEYYKIKQSNQLIRSYEKELAGKN